LEFKDSTLKWRLDQIQKCYNIADIGMFSQILEETQLYYDRYEKVRLLSVPQYSRIIKRNMKGERFDDIVDKL